MVLRTHRWRMARFKYGGAVGGTSGAAAAALKFNVAANSQYLALVSVGGM